MEKFIKWIIDFLVNLFRGQGRRELEQELEQEHAETERKFDEIDRRPVDPDSALERMRRLRRAEDAARRAGAGDDSDRH